LRLQVAEADAWISQTKWQKAGGGSATCHMARARWPS
jgi:hypothetical protein